MKVLYVLRRGKGAEYIINVIYYISSVFEKNIFITWVKGHNKIYITYMWISSAQNINYANLAHFDLVKQTLLETKIAHDLHIIPWTSWFFFSWYLFVSVKSYMSCHSLIILATWYDKRWWDINNVGCQLSRFFSIWLAWCIAFIHCF